MRRRVQGLVTQVLACCADYSDGSVAFALTCNLLWFLIHSDELLVTESSCLDFLYGSHIPYQLTVDNTQVAFDWPYSGIRIQKFTSKVIPEKILVLSEYKRDLQHHFPTKVYIDIFLNFIPEKKLEVIPFIRIPE